jgi:hypothetical protein
LETDIEKVARIKNHVDNKLIASIHGFSDGDLLQLAEILEHPAESTSLQRMIREILALRKTERKAGKEKSDIHVVKDDAELVADSNPAIQLPRFEAFIGSDENLKNMLFDILQDRGLFASTHDVIEAINSFFDCDLDYEGFRRRGRRDAIRRCWTQLLNLPKKERSELLRRFFEAIYGQEGDRRIYRELFKLLTNHD